ncbi:PREDICTED: protein root UVB sensitive 2, chloroplastic isoform X1 [Nicotiana attenuata]|uniref:Protein root uvb sensitive 2, chloroplastic n=1 Tax=Nicotiana attenuata TaxID=49451 RepID=A0A1J6IG41_NICAT|nr:PREDICTED: protein root UVB sensitive 2, chloroplastic isoform X1 [Nicotiana attenuata]XP_019254584.1 PREDICTED: protein root UVB sensitive 2, chloroplastic isoform X1 [Nicotiana attenuata]OIS97898.1 protein root uvb sensitive 2, chloroplastic [Nicotiana attenuata]
MKTLIKMQRKEADELPPQVPISWVEISSSVSRQFQFEPDGKLSVKMVDDSRPVAQRMVESFLNKFFPSGYPYSVNEGYLRYTQFRALQHFTSAALSVLSTQSLLFAAGLRPTPAQATAVSWILKDGMQHVGKLICSNLGARMDSEPKRWRILADVLYDLGTGLEVMSPLCPHLFLEVAGLGNFAKGMAVVAARATRLPIYSSFAKEGNLSDLFAKGEAISTLFNVLGLGAGIHLASNICSSMQGKLVVAPLLSIMHVYSVCEEMRATPVNTLNPQRTAMIVAEFVKTGKISSPADLRYQENLVFPGRLIEDAGNVKVGRSLHEVVSPSKLRQFKETFPEEKFLLNRGSRWTDMILEHDATGEDALRGWMVAAYASDMERLAREPSTNISQEAYEKMNSVFSPFLAELQAKGWHTDRFLDGTGSRFVF